MAIEGLINAGNVLYGKILSCLLVKIMGMIWVAVRYMEVFRYTGLGYDLILLSLLLLLLLLVLVP